MAENKKAKAGHYPAPSPNVTAIIGGCVAGLAAELILLGINRAYARANTFAFTHTLILILAIAAAVGVVYFTVCLLRAKDDFAGQRLYAGLGLLCLILCLSFLVMRSYWLSGIKVLYFLWGGLALLFILNQIYHREFILLAGLTGLAAVGAFAACRSMRYAVVSSTTIIITVVLVLTALIVLILTILAGKKNGMIRLFGQDVPVYAIPISRVLLCATAVVVMVCAIAALMIGGTFCYYCFFVALAWLLISAAFYTIRLM